jgi:hypothetical protein
LVALLLALGLVGGIVGLTARQADDPTIKRYLQRRRLSIVARKPDSSISLLDAEDALVLARRLEERVLVTRFARLVASLRKNPRTPR